MWWVAAMEGVEVECLLLVAKHLPLCPTNTCTQHYKDNSTKTTYYTGKFFEDVSRALPAIAVKHGYNMSK